MPDLTPNDPGQTPPAPGQPNPPAVTLESLQKQVEDLMTLTKKQAAENENLRDDLSRTSGMLATMARGNPNPNDRPNELMPRGWDDVEKLGVPAEAAERIAQTVETRVAERYRKERELEQNFETLKRQFYSDNPDLKGHEPIVQHFAQEVGSLFPAMETKKAYAEVAKRCREYIQSKLKPSSGNEPPPVLPGGRSSAPGSGAPTPPPSGEADDIQDEIAQRQRLRMAASRL